MLGVIKMSFFFADGIIYHCDKCKKNQDIAIEEGGKYFQIGDGGVLNQYRLNNFYRTTNKIHFSEGYICSNCLKKENIDNELWNNVYKIEDNAYKIYDIYNFYQSKVNKKIFSWIKEWLEKYSFKNNEIALFEKLLSDKQISDIKIIKKRVNSLLHGHEVKFKYATMIKNDICNSRKVKLLNLIEENYQNDSREYAEKIKEIRPFLGQNDFTIWREVENSFNVNPYICYERTIVNTEVITDEEKQFYFAEKITPNKFFAEQPILKIFDDLENVFYHAEGIPILRNKLKEELVSELKK